MGNDIEQFFLVNKKIKRKFIDFLIFKIKLIKTHFTHIYKDLFQFDSSLLCVSKNFENDKNCIIKIKI